MEKGRRLADRRLRPRWRVALGAHGDPRRDAAADRLPLPLRLRNAGRRGGVYHLVHVPRGGRLMMSWPILSVTTFLPLVGALFIVLMRSDGEAEQRNARWVA